MKLVIDAMGAPGGSGGMNLYARELLRAWVITFPEDDITIIGGPWIDHDTLDLSGVRRVVIRPNGILVRGVSQLVLSGLWAWYARADALLSLSPIVSPLFPTRRRAAIVHDWRHLRRPDEFTKGQRLYRKCWEMSLRSAGLVVAISKKTARETRLVVSPKRMVIVRNGGDHALRWRRESPPLNASENRVVTFGHLNNKRPEPVIEAVARLRVEGRKVSLIVLGASGAYRESLLRLVERRGLQGSVTVPGFVSDADYERTVSQASVVVMNSSDEGFGLPASEAHCLGIPVIVASDSGLSEIHGDSVVVSDPDAASLKECLSNVLNGSRLVVGEVDTWDRCAREIRRSLCGLGLDDRAGG